MKFSKRILNDFIELPSNWIDLMEDIGLEVKSFDGKDVMNLELLANRGDHYCYMGLVREIFGRTSQKINFKPSLNLFEKEPDFIKYDKYLKYENVDYLFDIETEKCLAYSLTQYSIESLKEVEDDYKYMLNVSDINIINPAIDVTNIIMLEFGQPSHVYDLDKIVGKIRIRDSKKGEKADLFFHKETVELPEGICVISDDEKILCIGGVIGCRGAEVDKNTKNIVFETALFDPVSVRKTERLLLDKPTIAAQIFERGASLDNVKKASERALYLFNEIGIKKSSIYQYMYNKEKCITKSFPLPDISSALSVDLSKQSIVDILSRYGFITENDICFVPSSRVWDIMNSADLVEEVARSIGYNNIPSKLPIASIGVLENDKELRKSKINSYLVNNGFFEIFTENLYSLKHSNLSPIKEHVKIENSVDGGYSFMKNNCIVQATQLISKNISMKTKDIYAFEWGKVFYSDYSECEKLWGVLNSESGVCIYKLKGILEGLLNSIDVNFSFNYYEESDNKEFSLLVPKRRIKIISNGIEIGFFGEIKQNLLLEFDCKNVRPAYFCFDVSNLLNIGVKEFVYKSPSNLIQSTRSISLDIPFGLNSDKVINFIFQKYNSVRDIKITDIYEKEKSRNLTFLLEFSGINSTVEINSLILEIMDEAKKYIDKIVF